MSDSTLFSFISTQKVTAGAAAADSEAAPGGTQGCYIYVGSELIHIDPSGPDATTSSAPIGANSPHYIQASEFQTISFIRGGSTDGDVWFTWVKS